MSRWTHVIGSIQCSWNEEEAIERLGKPILWGDTKRLGLHFGSSAYRDYMDNVWKKAFDDNKKDKGIPMGSEGSIDWYFVKTNDMPIGVGEGTLIAIQGDLRDYGEEKQIQRIINWFKKATERVRFATLTIEDEWSDEYIVLIRNYGQWIENKIKENKE